MPRKSIQKPQIEQGVTTPKPAVEKPKVEETPIVVKPPVIEVKGTGERTDDGKTINRLVVQKVSVPFVFVNRGVKSTTYKDYLRLVVRPDGSHDEPDAHWDEHEQEDEVALRQLFATYGKGNGTEISVRMNVDAAGKEEFFLDVRHPKPKTDDEDDKLPSVLIDPKDSIGDIVSDLFYAMSEEDCPDDFVSRGSLEDLVEELKGDVEELEPIKSLLDRFDMPGDMPANLYDLPTRLESIFRKAKGLS